MYADKTIFNISLALLNFRVVCSALFLGVCYKNRVVIA